MTREEKCKLAIKRGYIYNPETGLIYNKKGKLVTSIINSKKKYIKIQSDIFLLGHHFAWYCVYKECVECIDHINGIINDNRICNLRSVTNQQNQWNQINAKGYTWNKKTKKWQSQISYNNKVIFLGSFDIEQEARNAYLQAKEKYHKI
jgi:hypothetical protein